MDEEALIGRGVEVLSLLEHGELSLAECMDRIELVTTEPRLQQAILERAGEEGVIEREGAAIRTTSHAFLRYESDVIRKEGDFTCRRCGASLKEGHFLDLDGAELGPFGSSCVRKLTGRR